MRSRQQNVKPTTELLKLVLKIGASLISRPPYARFNSVVLTQGRVCLYLVAKCLNFLDNKNQKFDIKYKDVSGFKSTAKKGLFLDIECRRNKFLWDITNCQLIDTACYFRTVQCHKCRECMVMWMDPVPITDQVPDSVAIIIILCKIFTIIYLQQTVFIAYIVLQLFCFYNLCYM